MSAGSRKGSAPRALVVAVFLTGCTHAAPRTPIALRSGSPDAKEVVGLVFRNADVRLDADPSCVGAGTSRDDVTIGDFLAGFLAEQTEGAGANWLDVSCKEAASGGASDGPAGWDCRMLVRRRNGEERWGWGVGFFVRASDRQAVRSSFRCLGAG